MRVRMSLMNGWSWAGGRRMADKKETVGFDEPVGFVV